MARGAEAYDISLVNVQNLSTAPALEPRRKEEPRREKKQNVVQLPEKELRKNARRKIHPFKALLCTIAFVVAFSTFAAVVYGEMRLTELTDEIITSQKSLEEAQSLNVQLQMKVGKGISAAEVEKYAASVLGMTKVGEGQISFLSIDRDEGGVVVAEQDDGFFMSALSTIKSWFS